MLIDSHHHLWRYTAADYPWIGESMERLKRDFWTDELRTIAGEHSVDGFVTVQARQSLEETETLLELADSEPLIRGVVGWIDFRSEQAADQLGRFSGSGKLKGLRHVVQDEPDDRFLLRPDFGRGISVLAGGTIVYDVLIFARQLEPAIEFVDRHPDVPMVLDHIAKPVIDGSGVDATWKSGIERLSRRPNIACKFSGVATEVTTDEWDVDLIAPYWNIILEAFTPQRLMFGSDWPVCLLRTGYGRWLEAVQQLSAGLSDSERQELFGGTARRVYGLE